MTPDEIAKAIEAEARLDPETLAEIDRVFTKLCGRSYSVADMKTAQLPHGSQNGDGSKHPADSMARIKADFPELFGPGQ